MRWYVPSTDDSALRGTRDMGHVHKRSAPPSSREKRRASDPSTAARALILDPPEFETLRIWRGGDRIGVTSWTSNVYVQSPSTSEGHSPSPRAHFEGDQEQRLSVPLSVTPAMWWNTPTRWIGPQFYFSTGSTVKIF